MTRAEMIENVRGALARVAKAAKFTDAARAALAKVADRAAQGIAEIAAESADADGEETYDVYSTACRAANEIGMICSTICNGFPMVPAGEEVAKFAAAADEKLAPEAFLEHAADELEKAAGEPPETALPRLRALKMALYAWEDLPEGYQLVPVKRMGNPTPPTSETVAVTTTGAGNPELAAGSSAPPAAAVAKGEDVAAPVGFRWPLDLNGR